MFDRVNSELVCPLIPRDREGVVQWIIDLQCTLTGLTRSDFLVPESAFTRPNTAKAHPYNIEAIRIFGKDPVNQTKSKK